MLTVETIGRVRREFHVKGKTNRSTTHNDQAVKITNPQASTSVHALLAI
jgi:hypothetical protein